VNKTTCNFNNPTYIPYIYTITNWKKQADSTVVFFNKSMKNFISTLFHVLKITFKLKKRWFKFKIFFFFSSNFVIKMSFFRKHNKHFHQKVLFPQKTLFDVSIFLSWSELWQKWDIRRPFWFPWIISRFTSVVTSDAIPSKAFDFDEIIDTTRLMCVSVCGCVCVCVCVRVCVFVILRYQGQHCFVVLYWNNRRITIASELFCHVFIKLIIQNVNTK